jgi:large subunit ribosomal protein L32
LEAQRSASIGLLPIAPCALLAFLSPGWAALLSAMVGDSTTALRASHWRAVSRECPRCQEPRLSHRVCANCGYYHDREVFAQDKADET